MKDAYTTAALRTELNRYKQELIDAGLELNTIHTYVDRARRFVWWLDGEYTPGKVDTHRVFESEESTS
jgi:hypothetical protein